MFRSKWIYLLAAMIPVALMAAVAKDYRIVQDRFILGTPSGPDPVIKFQGTTATLKANRSANRLEFADDGATFVPVGTPFPTVTQLSGAGTFNTPTGAKWLKVIMIGAGGGGAGGGVNGTAGSGTAGGATTFGALSAGGGIQGDAGASDGGLGGTNTFSGSGYNWPGGRGGAHVYFTNGGLDIGGGGGYGGNSCAGGGGMAGSAGGGIANAGAGVSLSGGGGGGGGAGSSGASVVRSGAGAGSGGCIVSYINSPSATYAYAIGAGGTAGTAGTTGGTGGAGASGTIIVFAYF